MPRLSLDFLNRRSWRQFIKFSLVGVLNTGVDFGIYVSLTRLTDFWGEHFVLASCLSFAFAATSSFLLNTFWTFQAGQAGWGRRAGRFYLVAVGGITLNAAILWALTSLGVWDIMAKAFATCAVLFWNFSLQKKWTFSK